MFSVKRGTTQGTSVGGWWNYVGKGERERGGGMVGKVLLRLKGGGKNSTLCAKSGVRKPRKKGWREISVA